LTEGSQTREKAGPKYFESAFPVITFIG